jgi:NADH-quinone oxidoreductase subunit F
VLVALRLAGFYRHESCGKCVPCREGTNWTVKILERIDRGEATPIDLDVMEDMNRNIIGNCLCVLGDSMAAPIISMIKHFRPEFEEHIERAARRRADEQVGGAMPDLAQAAASAPGEVVA